MMICFYSIENRRGERFFGIVKDRSKKWVKKEKVLELVEAGFFVDIIVLVKDEFEKRTNDLFEKFCKRKISQEKLLEEAEAYVF